MRTAILAAFLAACGSSNPSAPDAAVDAHNPDAAPDAAPAQVVLTLYDQGKPLAGVDVVFADPAGAMLAHDHTDASGAAAEVVPAGSSVTAAFTAGNSYAAVSFVAVEPGDALTWGDPSPSQAQVGPAAITLPGAAAGAARYEVRLGCATWGTTDAATPVTGTITQDCLGTDDVFDVVALAFDAGDALVAYTTSLGVTPAETGTTAVTLGAWQTAMDPLAVHVTGAPAGASAARLQVNFRRDGLPFGGPSASAAITGGAATLSTGYLQGGVATALQYLVFVDTPTQPQQGVILRGHDGTPAADSYDLAQVLLPAVSGVAAAPASGRVSLAWSSAGSLASTDGAIAVTSWSAGAAKHLWLAVLPPGSTSPTLLPSLPDDLAAYRPAADATLTAGVIFVEGDYVADYRAMRNQIAFRLIGLTAFETLPATGGTMRATIGGTL